MKPLQAQAETYVYSQ